MKKIWKYTITDPFNAEFDMPPDTEILSCKVQRTNICIWAMIDDDKLNILERRKFYVIGTGIDIRDDISIKNFIGTVMMDDHAFVFHIFELN